MAESMEIDGEDLIRPNSIWLHGVDTLSTNDVKGYMKRFTEEDFKIEWINDSCLNIVFEDAEKAKTAIKAISKDKETEFDDDAEREAEQYDPSKPETEFRTRISKLSDKKVKNAAVYSRFYLFNPKEERRSRRRSGDRDYRDRDTRVRRTSRSFDDDGDLFPEKAPEELPKARDQRDVSPGRDDDLFPTSRGGDLFDRIKPVKKDDKKELDDDDLLAKRKALGDLIQKKKSDLFDRIG